MGKICIRVDGNEIIATGHVMRCLSIAEQIRKSGVELVFVLADNRPLSMIREKGFDVHILNTIWNDLNSEIEHFCKFILDNQITTILLDSYYVTEEYMTQVSKVANVSYIDDLDLFIYPVHTVINYNLQWDRGYREKYNNVGLSTTFLLGGSYAPLREEFSFRTYTVKDSVDKVLITTGGTDQLNMTYLLLDAFLKDSQTTKLKYHVIIGRFNNNKEAIFQLANDNPNIMIHENVCDMAYWMRYCDVAISAAGTTKFELCACGIPSICFEVADNQEGAKDWELGGYMLYAGNAYKSKEESVSKCLDNLKRLCNDIELRRSMSHNMQMLIDGTGAERVAQYLIGIN